MIAKKSLLLSLALISNCLYAFPEKSPVLPKPVVAEVKAAPSPIEKIDDEACFLINKLINLEDKSLNWKDFCNQMATIYDKDVKFKSLSETFRSLSLSTNTYYIGYQLSWYKSILPPKTYTLLYKYSSSELSHFIAERIKLNPRP